MRLTRRLERLERLCPPPPPDRRQNMEGWHRALRRWIQRLCEALLLAAEDDQERIRAALRPLRESFQGPYAAWLRDLRQGRCRMPELTPAVMKDLLLTWLSPEADGGMVCRACGLEYPQHRRPPLSMWKLLPGKRPMEGPPPWYDLPEFFTSCPHCGASRFETDWPHHVPEHDRPWKRLDGYAGVVGDTK
jgi:hypothetical protein